MNYEFFMEKCLELAKKGEGHVSPNPLVGCVITDDSGNIISTGYHKKYGEAHAEQNALKKAGEKAKGATLFVNLEPCNHYGKTPPCAKLIIEAGIKRVVVGTRDTSIKAQDGIKTLCNAGIEVIENILEDKCKKLNEFFFFSLENNRPFIAIKTATTLDGKIAASDYSSKWITSENSRNIVQQLRNKYDAILTTAKTVKIDNPSLTCRIDGGRNPVRVIIDRKHELSDGYNVFNNDGTEILKLDTAIDETLDILYKKGIRSVLIEAGGTYNAALLQHGCVDKIYQFIAPKIVGDNDAIPWVNGLNIKNINLSLKFKIAEIQYTEPDILLEMTPIK